ncbi:MAG: TetR family transcriptional regulator C-terminal domain-containing protein, partial [Proteobacteria bacterium]|nr:TetR family transcriptional regulator C-terminal domain-containing protein [Pseudomonadota bacterium]
KALGLAVIDDYIYAWLKKKIFDPLKLSHRPLDTLLKIISESRVNPSIQIELGCPLNNLMQEMSSLDKEFNAHLIRIQLAWQKSIENAIRHSQQQGEVSSDLNAEQIALFIFSSWEGCMGTAKVNKSKQVLSGCLEVLEDYILYLKS